MQIPKRLQVIGNLIPEGAYIADIGADHGLLEQYIALNFENYHILAVENKVGPLTALHSAVSCLKNVDISHSDGLNQVTSEYDTIVLAGMGGDTIIEILSKNKKKLDNVKRIIVDAHSFIPKVREAITGFGFNIECEKIVFENNHYYIIISFLRNEIKQNYTSEQIEYGYNLYLDPLYEDYKKRTISKLLTIKKNLSKSGKNNEKIKLIDEEIRRFESYGQN